MGNDTSNVTPIRRERTLGELIHDLRTACDELDKLLIACDELDKLLNAPAPWPLPKLVPGTPDPRD